MWEDKEVAAIYAREVARQKRVLRMIPSENIVSDAVRAALGGVFVNKYAEGYPGKRYYQGQENNDAIERLAIERACALFGAEHANVQSYSGSPANMAAYFALCSPGDRIVGLGLNSGGHLTHGWKVNFSGKLYEPTRLEVEPETERLDYDKIAQTCREIQPKCLFIGTTSYSRVLDWARLREIADEVGAYLVADIAHVAGLVVAGAYPSPVPYADIVTMTSHKTLRGPRGGMILCKEKHAQAVDRAVFPGMQGGPHMNQVMALAVALGEAARPAFKEYGHQIVKNAQCLAQHLVDAGLRIVSGGTDCHMMVVDLRAKNVLGKTAAIALEEAGIVCNFNAIPYDPNPPRNPSGIRLGTPSLTSRGFKEPEMARVAQWIVQVLDAPEDAERKQRIAAEIEDFLKDYPVAPVVD